MPTYQLKCLTQRRIQDYFGFTDSCIVVESYPTSNTNQNSDSCVIIESRSKSNSVNIGSNYEKENDENTIPSKVNSVRTSSR